MIRYCITGLIFVFFVTPGYAQNQSPPTAPWFMAGHISLEVTDPEAALIASWQFDRAENGDIRIVKQEQHGSTKIAGTLMSICDDQALLFKNIAPPQHHEMSELDQPILLLQLVLKLLARAQPQGPQAVIAASTIDVSDEKTPLRVHKGNVKRDFAAPWQAHIVVERGLADSVKFKIVFSYTANVVAARNAMISAEGVWRQTSDTPVLDDVFSLENWRIYRVDTVANSVAGNAQFNPKIISSPMHFKTIGELRSRIERNLSENLRARKQFICK